MKIIFMTALVIGAIYLIVKIALWALRPYFLSKMLNKIEDVYERILNNLDKEVNKIYEDIEKYDDESNLALRIVSSKKSLEERVNLFQGQKKHEEDLHGVFIKLQERFIHNPKKFASLKF